MAVPRRGNTWNMFVQNPVINKVAIDGDTEDVSVTYAITHNGSAYLSGSLTWDTDAYPNMWSKSFPLPATAGVMTVVFTVSATIDGENATGTLQQSLRVV